MNRIRIASALTVIIGAIYAAVGLFDSLQSFALGLIVAAAGVLAYGAADFIDSRRADEMNRYRAEVWHRREAEAREAAQRPGIYDSPERGR